MGEFAGGLFRGMAAGQQHAQQRELQKQTLDLQQKKFKLEEQESDLKMQMLKQQIEQQGGILNWLNNLGGGGQAQGRQTGLNFPAIAQPPSAELPTGFNPTQGTPLTQATPGVVTPMMPSPQGGMTPAPQAGGLQLGGVNLGKEGVSLRLEPPSLQRTQTTLDVGGQPTVFQGTFDPRTGQSGGMQALGPAPVGQRLEQLRAEARSLGFQEGTKEFEDAVGSLGIVEKLPEAQRSLALDQLKSRASQSQPQVSGGRSFTEQFKAASVLQADRITQETAAREQAKLEFGGLGQEEQKAVDAYTIGLANAKFILNNFTETELQTFVGLLQRPKEQAKLVLNSVSSALGLSAPLMESRFAEFKVANEKMRSQAFAAGGKQLTPFEASVVFGFTPTGRELTPAEYMSKMRLFIANAEAGRQARLELARTSGGKIDPAKLEQMIQARLQGTNVPQQAQPQPSRKKPNGKLRFNPQSGRIE